MSTPDNHNWLSLILTQKFGKWTIASALMVLLYIALFVFIVVICVGFFTNKHVNIFGLDIGSSEQIKKTKQDSAVVQTRIIHDTQYIQTKPIAEKAKPIIKDKVSKGNVQKIDSGSSGLQNNGTNNGLQAGRDINISNERRLRDDDKVQIMAEINKYITHFGLKKKCINIMMASNSNGQRLAGDLATYLRSVGFEVQDGGFFSVPTQNVRVVYDGTDPENDCLIIEIGLITVP